ncbi:BTAD domain-containing putative transcriptional regulator [Streptomyces sp. RK9]|uniref:AfsR/SARP family transcriptional regulator n=1 Tax=Streptomyces sp. RK9 TaxID=3239284 RepID=UPI00386D8864
MANELRFGLIGVPAVYDAAGEPHPVRSPKARALLTALLLEPDRAVSADALKDALWAEGPPASAHASLQNHVTRLRRLLDDPDRLRAVPSGYRLRVDDGELDVRVFERRFAQARAAHAERDWPAVEEAARAALALWRGTPLSGLPTATAGHALVQRLEESRLLLLECRYDALLEAAAGAPGRHLAELAFRTPELASLVAEHPLRETFHRQLMLLLHRTGRQAEALAVHRALRRRLVEELGVEPGEAVREAHGEVLRGEAAGGAAPDDANPLRTGAAPLRTGATPPPDRPHPHAEPAARTAPERQPPPRPGTPPRKPHPETPPRKPQQSRSPHQPEPPQPSPSTAKQPPGPPRALLAGGRQTASAPTRLPRPAQLPPKPPHFTGRTSESRRLRELLTADHDVPGAGAGAEVEAGAGAGVEADAGAEAEARPRPAAREGRPRVAVLAGMAGVGKSALAVHTAHELRADFPDGQLYLNLHGATPGMPPLPPGQALAALLRDLGAEARHAPEDPDAAAALLRSLLAPTRTLLVLDDAASAAQVRPLLPGGPGCAVIVTSRSQLTALDGAARFPLGPLSDADSAALLRAASGREGLAADHPLVALAGRLPLALRIVAARLAARSALTPDALAGLLAECGDRLHHLEHDDLSVRRSLDVALASLRTSDREGDRDAARALCAVGALDLPEYGAPLLARLLALPRRRAQSALDRLVDVALLDETAYGRYAPHDLVRDFAREHASPPPESADRAALAWYTATARNALLTIMPDGQDKTDRLGPPDPRPAPTPGTPADAAAASAHPHASGTLAAHADASADDDTIGRAGPHTEAGALGRAEPGTEADARSDAGASAEPDPHTLTFPTPDQAFAWADQELGNVVRLVERHAGDGSGLVPRLVRYLFPYLQRRGRLTELDRLCGLAVGAARRRGEPGARAQALSDLAGHRFMAGRAGEALALNDEALDLWRALGDTSSVRRALNHRGLLLEGLGRHAESAAALRQALDLARGLDDPLSEAITYSHLGNLYEHTDARAAITHHERSLAIGERIGHLVVRQSAHCNIGYARLTLGEPAAARGHFEEALRLHGEYQDWHGESQSRLGLVRALRELARAPDAARECALLLDRAEHRGDTHMAGLARHQHGLLLHAEGRTREAYAQWEAALAALASLDGVNAKVVAELKERLA